jgi:hypothetical protein
MISRPTGHLRHNTRKAQRFQVQFVNEDIDDADRIVFSHVVVKEFGKQNPLRSILALDKALHQEPRLNPQDSNPTNVFTQPGPRAPLRGWSDERAVRATLRSKAKTRRMHQDRPFLNQIPACQVDPLPIFLIGPQYVRNAPLAEVQLRHRRASLSHRQPTLTATWTPEIVAATRIAAGGGRHSACEHNLAGGGEGLKAGLLAFPGSRA